MRAFAMELLEWWDARACVETSASTSISTTWTWTCCYKAQNHATRRGSGRAAGYHGVARGIALRATEQKLEAPSKKYAVERGRGARCDQADVMMRSPVLKVAGFTRCLGMPLLTAVGNPRGIALACGSRCIRSVSDLWDCLVGEDHSLPMVGLRRSSPLVDYWTTLPGYMRQYGLEPWLGPPTTPPGRTSARGPWRADL